MLIEARVIEDWRDLQEAVARILLECGMVANVELTVSTVRGEVDVDVYALDELQAPPVSYVCECKHWKTSAVPKAAVHGLRTVVEDIGANWGFLISSSGFQTGAHAAAENSNVKLITWTEFQELFADRWYQTFGAPRLRERLDPLVEYTEAINSRIFRKADALPPAKRKAFKRLRGEHFALGMPMSVFFFPLPGEKAPFVPDLPLADRLAEDPHLAGRLPNDVLTATTLREFVDLVCQHGESAIAEFDQVFGERA